jgi:hypothetical protein
LEEFDLLLTVVGGGLFRGDLAECGRQDRD